jgi:spore germination cell wall hydrolase CwlJ-like protein
MKSILRAGGVAAAAFVFVSSLAFSDASVASSVQGPQSSATYLDHAAATIEGAAQAEISDDAPAAASAQQFSGEVDQHAVSKVAATMLQTLNATIPGEQSLNELVGAYGGTDTPNTEQECLARAVYFEARSEPLEGQLAVADVVLNRTKSGRYPTTICAVVTQRAQFSFIQNGRFPEADRSSEAWRKAVAIALIARERLANEVAPGVLWYHADYVAPIWRHNLRRVTKIGAHIFYS